MSSIIYIRHGDLLFKVGGDKHMFLGILQSENKLLCKHATKSMPTNGLHVKRAAMFARTLFIMLPLYLKVWRFVFAATLQCGIV